jgi:ATP-dependent Lon protease
MAETDKDDLVSIIEDDDKELDIPDILPMMPVRDVVIFTDMILPLFVGRKKSVYAVDEAVSKDRFLFLATQKDPTIEDPEPDEIYTIGTISRILRMLKLPDGRLKALVQGIAKAEIVEYVKKDAAYIVKVEPLLDDIDTEIDLKVEALMRNVRENCEKILALRGEFTADISNILESIDSPGKLADLVASNLKLKIEDAQSLLAISDTLERLKKVNDFLIKEVELSAMQAKIQSDVRDEISKSQRDYYLREQVRAIHRELGEVDEKLQEIEEYKKRIKKAKMPKNAAQEAAKQLRRLEQMHPDSSEASIVRTYLDWLVDMPWKRSTMCWI